MRRLIICTFLLSLPAWGAWIEIDLLNMNICKGRSLPAWGAWIEIRQIEWLNCLFYVAPRMGSVD